MKKQRKSPWRFAFLAVAVMGALELLCSAAAWLLCRLATAPGFPVGEAASIGIIGGADGPTAIFVTGPGWTSLLLPLLLLIVGAVGYLWLCKYQKAEKDGA